MIVYRLSVTREPGAPTTTAKHTMTQLGRAVRILLSFPPSPLNLSLFLSLSLSLSLSVTFRGNFRFRLAALPLASIQTGSKERDLSRRGQLTTRARRDAYVALADQSVQGYRLLPRRDALTARHRHRHRRRRPAHAADRNAQTRISPRWRRYIHPPPRNVPVAIPAPTPTLHPSTASASPKLHPLPSLSLPSQPLSTLCFRCSLADHPAISVIISPSF